MAHLTAWQRGASGESPTRQGLGRACRLRGYRTATSHGSIRLFLTSCFLDYDGKREVDGRTRKRLARRRRSCPRSDRPPPSRSARSRPLRSFQSRALQSVPRANARPCCDRALQVHDLRTWVVMKRRSRSPCARATWTRRRRAPFIPLLDLAPAFGGAHVMLGRVYVAKGLPARAVSTRCSVARHNTKGLPAFDSVDGEVRTIRREYGGAIELFG